MSSTPTPDNPPQSHATDGAAGRPESGRRVTVTIEKLIHGGRGIGRVEGLPVFVEGALPGERIEAVVAKAHRTYLEARLIRVVLPSPDRVAPPCEVFGVCGGCRLQHLAYPAQLAAKREILEETLRRLGGVTLPLPPVVPSPAPYEYRLRARLHVRAISGPPQAGFYAATSHTLVPISSCAVLHPRIGAALSIVRDALADSPLKELRCDAVELQTTAAAAEIVIVLHLGRLDRPALGRVGRALQAQLPLRGLVAYDRSRHRWVGGGDCLDERIAGERCRVSDRTFVQVNAPVNEALVSTVVEWAALTGHERVVDLYAGFGNFSLPLARRARHTTAVETVPSAVADARANARRLGGGLTVIAGDVESWRPSASDAAPDVLIVDPPRTGLSPRALAQVIALAPGRILYVSCEPATLSRDIIRLTTAGFHATRVMGFDLFPQTSHVEALAELVHS